MLERGGGRHHLAVDETAHRVDDLFLLGCAGRHGGVFSRSRRAGKRLAPGAAASEYFDAACIFWLVSPEMLRGFRWWSSLVLGVSLVFAVLAPVAGAQGALHIVVLKRQHLLEVVQGDRIVRLYRVSLGFTPLGPKQIRGDGKTPVGLYTVYDKRPSDRFRWFLALNYPSSGDADRAFKAGLI